MIHYGEDFNALKDVYSIKINNKAVYQKEHNCIPNLIENTPNVSKLTNLQYNPERNDK